jgi:hypothetical protein
VIPSAAYLIMAELTRRTCLPEGNTPDTRRLIRKLVIHFGGSKLPESVHRIAEANLAAVDPADPTTYSLRCLSALARIVWEEQRHRELIAKFDGLAESNDSLSAAVGRLGGSQ